jgi:hypothetical protein
MKWLLVFELSLAEFFYPVSIEGVLMFSFFLFLGVSYLAGVAWGFARSGGVKWDWEWPVRLVWLGWNKLFGADSVFDKKEDK